MVAEHTVVRSAAIPPSVTAAAWAATSAVYGGGGIVPFGAAGATPSSTAAPAPVPRGVAFSSGSGSGTGSSSDSDVDARRQGDATVATEAAAASDTTALTVAARRGRRGRGGAAAAADDGGAADADADAVPPERRLFAVIALGGTQYKVTQGDVINAERIPSATVGSVLPIDAVLAVGNQSRSVIGRPTVPAFRVMLAVEEHADDAKVTVFKMRRRKRYMRTKGHRRMVTRLRVVGIEGELAFL